MSVHVTPFLLFFAFKFQVQRKKDYPVYCLHGGFVMVYLPGESEETLFLHSKVVLGLVVCLAGGFF